MKAVPNADSGSCRASSPSLRSALVALGAATVLGLGASTAQATVTSITAGDLLPDAQVLDFEAGTPGPISGTDSLFTNFGLSNVTLTGTFEDTDNFNNELQQQALAALPVGMLGTTLGIARPGNAMDPFFIRTPQVDAGWVFMLQTPATQLGFLVVEAAMIPLRVTVVSGGMEMSLDASTSGFPDPLYFESDTPFEEFRITARAPIDAGNGWGIDNLTLAGLTPIPEPHAMTIFLTSSLVVGAAARRRTA